MTAKNWTLNAYTNDTWTDLVNESAIVATLILNNTSPSDVIVSVRLDDTGSLAEVLTNRTLSAGESYTLDLRSIAVTGTQSLQVKANGADVEFLASGVV